MAMLVLIWLDFLCGSIKISSADLAKLLFGLPISDETVASVFYPFRLPRVLTAIFAGAALPVAGVLMQALFRNPLASPSELGVTAGASLAVAVLVLGIGSVAGNANTFGGGISAWWANLPPSLAALSTAGAAALGSGIMLLFILSLASRITQSATLLIAGLLISNMVGALIGILQWSSNADSLRAFTFWGLGSLNGVDSAKLAVFIPLIFLGLLLAQFLAKPLNALVLGDETAMGLGVSIRYLRYGILFTASLLTGVVTAFCGPIAFLGLAVPLLSRSLLGRSDHRWIIPTSMILGICLLLVCDALSHLPKQGGVLPVNVLTALLGGPIILWVVLRREAE